MSSILKELFVKFKTVESRLEKLTLNDGSHIDGAHIDGSHIEFK